MITWRKTARGFTRGEFTDYYQKKASIQKSSLFNPQCIWLGLEWCVTDPDDVPIGARMHLSQEQVRDLLPILRYFALTGQLPEPPPE